MTEIRENYRLVNLDLGELNRVLGRLGDRLDELQGLRGTPTFHGDINAGGYRITNVGQAQANGDAVTKSELTGSEASTLAALAAQVSTLQTQIITERIPVGDILISTVSTNPASRLGYGIWEVWGSGKVIVGLDPTDSDFDAAEKTGGSKTVDLEHAHPINHTHPAGTTVDNDGAGSTIQVNDGAYSGNSGNAGSTAQTIVQPYIVAYCWKRTA